LPSHFIKKSKEILEKNPNFKSYYDGIRGIALIGGSGIGKTTIAHAVAKDLNLDIIELNASDVRTKESLDNRLRITINTSTLMRFTEKKSKGRLILIDEVDGGSGTEDRGGFSVLKEFIKTSKFPIILTANENGKRINPLRSVVQIFEVDPPSESKIVKYLQFICEKEKITYEDGTLEKIAKASNNDFRASVNDLQLIAKNIACITLNDITINSNRSIKLTNEESITKMFSAHDYNTAKNYINKIDMSYQGLLQNLSAQIFTMIQSKYYRNALESIKIADKTLRFILKNQDYSLLPYFFKELTSLFLYGKDDAESYYLSKIKWKSRSPTNSIYKSIQITFNIPILQIIQYVIPFLKTLFIRNRKIKEKMLNKWRLSERDWQSI